MSTPPKEFSEDLIESLMQVFIQNLMKYPGFHMRCPMPIQKGESPEEWKAIRMSILDRTVKMLTMMGIKHEVGAMNDTISVDIPP